MKCGGNTLIKMCQGNKKDNQRNYIFLNLMYIFKIMLVIYCKKGNNIFG